MRAVREGLLANLSPETTKKVTYQNADWLFRIPVLSEAERSK